jgi:hypothetical protein
MKALAHNWKGIVIGPCYRVGWYRWTLGFVSFIFGEEATN